MMLPSLPSLCYLSLLAVSVSSLNILEIVEISKIPNEKKRNGIIRFLENSPSGLFYNGKVHFPKEKGDESPPIEFTSLEEYQKKKDDMDSRLSAIMHRDPRVNSWGTEFLIAQELELDAIEDATRRDKIRNVLDSMKNLIFYDNVFYHRHNIVINLNRDLGQFYMRQEEKGLGEEELNLVAKDLIKKYMGNGYSFVFDATRKLKRVR